jgi:hypothetical protein
MDLAIGLQWCKSPNKPRARIEYSGGTMEITGLFGFLIFVADIWAVLKIIKSSASDGKKALWIAIVVVLPLVGLILWYLMGPGKPD